MAGDSDPALLGGPVDAIQPDAERAAEAPRDGPVNNEAHRSAPLVLEAAAEGLGGEGRRPHQVAIDDDRAALGLVALKVDILWP